MNIGDTGTGTVNIQNNATLNVTADLTVGGTNAYSGPLTDTLAIASGGTVTVGGSVTVGNNPNIVATMTIDGTGSSLQDSGGLLIGNNGAGQVTITGGASVSAVGIDIGGFSAAPSTLTVTGGSTVTATSNLLVGYNGNGTLAIQSGGTVSANEVIVGDQASASGTVTVDGSGSSLTSSTDLVVGFYGAGHLTVSNGARVTNANGYIGYEPGFANDATVTGAGSTWTNTGALVVGGGLTTAGNGSLTIDAGGTVNADGVFIGYQVGSVGAITIQGSNSILANTAGLAVGYGGTGTLLVLNGGTTSSNFGAIGGFSSGTVTVDGAGSKWTDTGDLIIGSHGAGTLTLANGGVTSVAGIVYLAQAAGSVGTLNIGAAPGSTAVGAGTLTASTIELGAGTGTINFNHTDTAYVFSAAIIGPGTINQISGVTDLTADSGLFTGATNITGGRLAVNGSLTNSQVTVASGGIL
ncbi:beta strand repeat-containing protein, partial [Telmatospirillum sp.]|uniref:beta strand repeat-containing protein n=1 Tax=Telmatospirillum sp. TaxID=2079197 RepID=UPI002850A12D|nr:hypothetical protein [Telmatospirillum sp.]